MRRSGALGPDRAAARQLHSAHDAFVEHGSLPELIRPMVLESWRRSVRGGLDPETSVAPIRLTPDELAEQRDSHPLAAVMPMIRDLLVTEAEQAGMIVAVSDAAGRMLWVEGDHQLRRRAEAMNFFEGTSWAEDDIGTNAPGTALALDRAVQIFRAEHLARSVTPWSCTAVPVHDPDTGSLLGALDLTGGDDVVGPAVLALVRATVRAAESELRLSRLTIGPTGPADPQHQPGPTLSVLGRHQAEWRTGCQLSRLSLRHSELLVLLSRSVDGLTGEALGTALSEEQLATVTVRAELSRLRQAISPYPVNTRPYRLEFPLDTDLDRLQDALRIGDHRRAVQLYRGPVLPDSDAPAIRELREEMQVGIRNLLLTAGDPDALLRFADTDFGRHDLQLWEVAAALLPERSSRRDEVIGRIRRLHGQES